MITLLLAALLVAQKPTPHAERIDLLDGCHAEFATSNDTAAKWQTDPPAKAATLVSRWVFHLDKKPDCAGLELHAESGSFTAVEINERAVRLPVKKMRYATLPGISPKLLRTGENTLKIVWAGGSGRHRTAGGTSAATVKLWPLLAGAIDFQTEPVLGEAGSDYFTVGCRTNLRAEVTLECDGRRWQSEAGVVHALRTADLKPNTSYQYSVVAQVTGTSASKRLGPFTVRTLPDANADHLRFVAVGDSRTYPKDWAVVAAAVEKQKPDCVVFSGDMVTDGRDDHLWDDEFFSMARPYFASIPCFYVVGNHEDNSPLVGRLLSVSARERWVHKVGPALFIGIDGEREWKTGSVNLRWLEDTLKASREKFIFLFSHYPPWTSGPHGAGHEHGILQGREFVMPLLKKYHATAFIAGHDHIYERSEPENGVPVIVSGGAGAPLYPKSTLPGQNPYSRVFVSQHHYCLLEISGHQCELKAFTPDGKQLDSTTWQARTIPAAP